MDEAAWAAQGDVCRCCMSARGKWDVNKAAYRDKGDLITFAQLIKDCGMALSFLHDPEASQVICSPCVECLKNAWMFHKQVVAAEEKFVKYFNKRHGIETEVKTEPEDSDHLGLTIESYDTGPTGDGDDLKTEIEKIEVPQTTTIVEQVSQSEQQVSQSDHQKPQSGHQKVVTKLKSDCETETQIVSFVNYIKQSQLDSRKTGKDYRNQAKVSTPAVLGPPQQVAPRVKPISERKQIILTCAVILKDTTACPFRHHKSWFQCFYCTKEFMDMSSLRMHTADTHQDIDSELRKLKRYPRSLQIDISNLECRYCHLSLTDVDAMRGHFESAHDKVIYKEFIADYKVDSSPYSCHLCKEEFHAFRTLTTHLNEHYANCICDVCGRSFLNSKRLKVHKRTHENGLFPCTECGKILKTKTSKANHMESVHSKRQLKCQICLLPMKHYNDRVKHMSEVHNITHTFKCKICSKEYNIKHYLATHMRQTHGNKNKKCHECDMVFITNHGLKKHMSKHTGVKPYKCLACGKAYARSYTLKEHMRGHDSDKL